MRLTLFIICLCLSAGFSADTANAQVGFTRERESGGIRRYVARDGYHESWVFRCQEQIAGRRDGSGRLCSLETWDRRRRSNDGTPSANDLGGIKVTISDRGPAVSLRGTLLRNTPYSIRCGELTVSGFFRRGDRVFSSDESRLIIEAMRSSRNCVVDMTVNGTRQLISREVDVRGFSEVFAFVNNFMRARR
jgi:hypothetical protein